MTGPTPASQTDRKPAAENSPHSRALDNANGEVIQGKIRIGVHLFLVALIAAAYEFDRSIAVKPIVITSIVSLFSATFLYFWALNLSPRNSAARTILRLACIASDNIFITLTLLFGGKSTAGIWALYIWTSIGYGVRFNTWYLRANIFASVASFLTMAWFSPFWSDHLFFLAGLVLAMTSVPLYAGMLIEKLHRALYERENAYRSKSQFVARMSHELRTPLHAIVSTSALLRRSSPNPTVSDYADIIALSSRTLLDLINQVLDLSKFEAGHLTLEDQEFQINELVTDIATIFRPQTLEKGVEIYAFCDPAASRLVAGPKQHLREVLLNMVGNAVKFTDRGQISIHARVSDESGTAITLHIEINDTGCGIDDEFLERIFDPFTQADTSNTRRHGGTGLGTTFSRELIRLMGGKIEVRSKKNVGTTVAISVPLSIPQFGQTLARTPPVAVAILVSPLSDNKLPERLTALGSRTESFTDPNTLIRRLSESNELARLDGVLVDADIYGFNLAGINHSISRACPHRIVPVVGFGSPSLRSAAIAAGYCTYLDAAPTDDFILRALSTIASFSASSQIAEDFYEPRTERALRVLIADDNQTNRRILSAILADSGHHCDAVSDGDQALFALGDGTYDLAILDMHMPGRDGIEVAKLYSFTVFGGARRIPIILLTADSTLEAKREAESAGIDVFLTKPVAPSHLLRAIDDLVVASSNRLNAPVGFSRAAASDEKVVPIRGDAGVNGEPAPSGQASRDEELPEIIDGPALTELLGFMSKQEQIQFFEEFMEDTESYFQVLLDTRSPDDVARAKDVLHSLAGAAGIVGAVRLSAMARKLEKLTPSALVMNLDFHLTSLRKCYDETFSLIQKDFK